MNADECYNPSTSVTSFLFNTDSFRGPNAAPFSSVTVKMRAMGLQTPQHGVTTFRVAAAAAKMVDETQVGVLRINIVNLPIASQSVVQQINNGKGTTMAYIPVEFNDRSAQTIPFSQPHIQLLNNVVLQDFEIDIKFKPLSQDVIVSPLQSLNMMMVMETDGTKSGNTSAFSA